MEKCKYTICSRCWHIYLRGYPACDRCGKKNRAVEEETENAKQRNAEQSTSTSG